MNFAPDKMLLVFIKWRRDGGGKPVARIMRKEIHKAFWLGNLKEGDH